MSATLLQSPAPAAPFAAPAAPSAGRPRWTRRAGVGMSAVAVLFLAVNTAVALSGAKEAVDGAVQLGYQPYHVPVLGAIQLACLALYLVPRTAPLGVVLWTGFLGGAVATHVRLDHPLLSHTLFPIFVAALLWGGLYLRDARVRALVGRAR
jgi:hypothetical protein